MSKIQGPESVKIKEMFSSIAHRYDHANTVLSAGIHHLWRSKLVRWSEAQTGQKVLDCATGTGDLAIEFACSTGPEGEVIGTDFCEEMLLTAPQKAKGKNVDVRFETADVTELPYADNYFDISSISFGIRNVEDPLKGISELARVVRPGGTVMILEFGSPEIPVFKQAYHFYSKKVLPMIGGWVSGNSSAYHYLQTSSAQFPYGKNFVDLMNASHAFESIQYKALSGGIAYIYKGRVKDTHH